MAVQLFANNAVTTLDAALGIGVLTLTVAAGDGALFPSPTAGDWFYATLESGANKEIVQVTTRATDVFTIVRAQEGTSDQSWSIGDTVELRVTAAYLGTVHTEDSLPAASIGDVTGPASATDSNLAAFDGATGKLLKDSGVVVSGSNTGDQTISDATISITDITTNDVDTSAHGFVPKAPNDVTQFLNGLGAWSTPEDKSLPEAVINGLFNIWQRGVTFTAHALGFSADRFEHVEVSAGVVDVSRVAINSTAEFHTLSGQKLPYALRYTVATADASVAAGDTVFISHKIEGYRALPYMHNEYTVSFFVRSPATGIYCLAARNEGPGSVTDRSFVKEFTIDVADTWERKEITVSVQDQTGSWNYDIGVGLQLTWCLMSGTTFGSATDDTWNSTNEVATTSQVNWMATITDTFDLAGIQIDLGPVAHPLRGMPIPEDLANCQRYYQKSYSHDDVPGATVTEGELGFRCIGTTHVEPINFVGTMRVPPTVTAHNPNNTGNDWYDETAAADVAVTFNVTGENRTVVGVTSVDTNQVSGHWEADAEM